MSSLALGILTKPGMHIPADTYIQSTDYAEYYSEFNVSQKRLREY